MKVKYLLAILSVSTLLSGCFIGSGGDDHAYDRGYQNGYDKGYGHGQNDCAHDKRGC